MSGLCVILDPFGNFGKHLATFEGAFAIRSARISCHATWFAIVAANSLRPSVAFLVSHRADVNALCHGHFPIIFARCESSDPAALKGLSITAQIRTVVNLLAHYAI